MTRGFVDQRTHSFTSLSSPCLEVVRRTTSRMRNSKAAEGWTGSLKQCRSCLPEERRPVLGSRTHPRRGSQRINEPWTLSCGSHFNCAAAAMPLAAARRRGGSRNGPPSARECADVSGAPPWRVAAARPSPPVSPSTTVAAAPPRGPRWGTGPRVGARQKRTHGPTAGAWGDAGRQADDRPDRSPTTIGQSQLAALNVGLGVCELRTCLPIWARARAREGGCYGRYREQRGFDDQEA